MRSLGRLSFLSLALFLLPRLAPAEVLRVTVESVSLHSQPDTSSSVVTLVTSGTVLDVIGKEGYWNLVRVRSTGQTGYIHSAFVEVDPAGSTDRPRATPNPNPPSPSLERASNQRSQPRTRETGYTDVGPFGVGGFIWDGISTVAFSPVLDFSPHASLLGTFDTTSFAGIRAYVVTGNILYRFSVRGSSPVTFEPFVGGGAAFGALADFKSKGFAIVGGTLMKFESLPHVKFSGGLMHIETWGDEDFIGVPFTMGGSTLMVGAHFFF